jgi:hypothetical protein
VVAADAYPNFSICGIPYYVSGEVTHWRNLAHRTIAVVCGWRTLQGDGLAILHRSWPSGRGLHNYLPGSPALCSRDDTGKLTAAVVAGVASTSM